MTPKSKDVMTALDFDARDMAIANGEMGEKEEEDDEEWQFALVLDGHDSEVKSVSWSAGGNLLATCSRDKSVWIWEEVGFDEYETVAVLNEHAGDVKCVSWHPEEELVASASYDDEVRLWREDVDDWGCCAVLRGHGGTVWGVEWERLGRGKVRGEEGEKREAWMARRETAGPRLLSCSDDLSVRVWRRRPRERKVQSRLSIIRSGGMEEEWVEEARLPVAHTRSVYAVAWGRGGRVVSTGGDGAVVVYEERWRGGEGVETTGGGQEGDATDGDASDANGRQEGDEIPEAEATEWVVVSKIEGAHGVFEVNHVAWVPRRDEDKEAGGDGEQEELIVTTGDDGTVKVWRLDV